jgi:hypothetical protein
MAVLEQLEKLSDDRFLEIYVGLEKEGYGPLDGEVARLMKFRPHAIKKLPFDQRARRARTLLQRTSNAELTYELFGGYLLAKEKSLITDFLDATGVEHDEGMIRDIENAKPAKDKLSQAIVDLDSRYSPQDVTLYLAVCAEQRPDVPELDGLWRLR